MNIVELGRQSDLHIELSLRQSWLDGWPASVSSKSSQLCNGGFTKSIHLKVKPTTSMKSKPTIAVHRKEEDNNNGGGIDADEEIQTIVR